MKDRFDGLVATVLASLLLVLPGTLSARERRGANLVITLKDGQQVEGELIAVKPDSLLLQSLSGKDEAVDLVGIKEIKVTNKSLALKGALYGFLAGAAVGAIVGLNPNLESDIGGSIEGVAIYAAAAGIPLGLIGLVVGAIAGTDRTIDFEGMSESDRARALDNLRARARIRDYK